RVRWVGPNRIFRLRAAATSEPNDPRYQSGEQWGLKMINMPEAWYLQKGGPNNNVAVIDSGGLPAHEDMIGQYDPASFDIADGDSDITADGAGAVGEVQHGAFVSSIICAKTDNALGMAGVCWQNIKCVMVKAQKKGAAAADNTSVLNSMAYVAAQA